MNGLEAERSNNTHFREPSRKTRSEASVIRAASSRKNNRSPLSAGVADFRPAPSVAMDHRTQLAGCCVGSSETVPTRRRRRLVTIGNGARRMCAGSAAQWSGRGAPLPEVPAPPNPAVMVAL